VWGYVVHEWGHYFAARAVRAHILPSSDPRAPKLFDFPVAENTDRQYVWLTVGGLAALWIQVAAFLVLLPWNTPAGVAALLFAIGGAIFTSVKEGPLGLRVALGESAQSVAREASTGSTVSA